MAVSPAQDTNIPNCAGFFRVFLLQRHERRRRRRHKRLRFSIDSPFGGHSFEKRILWKRTIWTFNQQPAMIWSAFYCLRPGQKTAFLSIFIITGRYKPMKRFFGLLLALTLLLLLCACASTPAANDTKEPTPAEDTNTPE